MTDTDRMTNLAFALLGSEQPRPAEWIRRKVEGYDAQQSDEAFTTMLRRDIRALRRAGVPIAQNEFGYAIAKEDYELPEATFTPEEARVLGLAGNVGGTGELGTFARSGWTKLAASGATRDLGEAPVFKVASDLERVPAELIRGVNACITHQQRMSFEYQAVPTKARVKRVMDPWGIVPYNNRIYIVGWDVEREAPRSFRAIRCSGVKRVREPATHLNKPENLTDIVKESLERGREYVDAVVRVPAGMAQEIAKAGTREGDLVYLKDVDKEWLVRTAASFAPEVEVLEPESLRAEIIVLLKEAM